MDRETRHFTIGQSLERDCRYRHHRRDLQLLHVVRKKFGTLSLTRCTNPFEHASRGARSHDQRRTQSRPGRADSICSRTETMTGAGESQLLERFLSHGDEDAFEAIVRRHGPMVLGVCRRVLSDPNDVEDAFQATFLVLVKRAGSIRDRSVLGTWLHGVARRVAVRAGVNARRRRAREQAGVEMAIWRGSPPGERRPGRAPGDHRPGGEPAAGEVSEPAGPLRPGRLHARAGRRQRWDARWARSRAGSRGPGTSSGPG